MYLFRNCSSVHNAYRRYLIFSTSHVLAPAPNPAISPLDSRIFAYPHSTDKSEPDALWTYTASGEVSGTPVLGSDPSFAYFTHNTDDGMFTALNVTDGVPSPLLTQSLSVLVTTPVGIPRADGIDETLNPITASRLFSPVGIAHSPSPDGNHRFGGNDNTNDLVVWAHMSEDGAPKFDGYYYGFQIGAPDSSGAVGVRVFDSTGWATLTPPVFTEDGQKMVFSTSKSAVRGWVGAENQYNNGADLRVEIARNSGRSGPNPTTSTASISPDGTKVFFASTRETFGFHSAAMVPDVDAVDTLPVWSYADIPALVMAGSQCDNDFVYFAAGSLLLKANAENGAQEWNHTAAAPIAAEYSLSTDGSTLYFVDSSGAMTAAYTSAGAVTTEKPTDKPTDKPTPEPTLAPVTNSPIVGTLPPTTTTTEAPIPTPTESPIAVEATEKPTVATPEPTPDPTSMPTLAPTAAPILATATPTDPLPTESGAPASGILPTLLAVVSVLVLGVLL